MKIFFGVYLALLIGVFALWAIEPLHRIHDASSIAIAATTTPTTPSKTIVAPAAAGNKTLVQPAKKPAVVVAPAIVPINETPSPSAATTTIPARETAPVPVVVAPPTPSQPTTPQTQTTAEQIAFAVHAKINEERAHSGLPALTFDSKLSALATAHSADMLSKNYFTHNDASGCSSSCRMSNAGYEWSAAGENIYMMKGYAITVDKAVDMIVKGWMESPGHRANILSKSFTNEGVGIVIEGETLYATEDFAKPLSVSLNISL